MNVRRILQAAAVLLALPASGQFVPVEYRTNEVSDTISPKAILVREESSHQIDWTFQQNGTALNLTGGSASLRYYVGDTVESVSATIPTPTNGTVRINFTPATTATNGTYSYDLVVTDGTDTMLDAYGKLTLIARGGSTTNVFPGGTNLIVWSDYTFSGAMDGVTITNGTFYGDGAGITNLTGTIADGDKGDITVSGSGATWTVDSGAVLLDEIGNPSGNKTFSMVDNQLRFNYVQPAEADGAFVIEASGAFSGDLTHIRQYTGNPGTGTDLLHLEATDADVTGLQVTVNDAARAIDVVEGDAVIQSGDLTITGNVNVATGNVTMATDGQQLVMGTGGLQVRAGSEILFLGTELDMNDGDIDQINDMQVTTLNGGIVSASVSLSGLTVISTRGATINNIEGDFDTQIKGDVDPYAFYLEASTDRTGFGTNAPASKVEVVGTVTATAFSGDGSALTAVDAATGDSATGFFDAGTLELARGGTGQSLTDPNADGIFLWDDSDTGSEINFAAIGSGLSFDGTTLSATASGAYVADSGGNATNLTLSGTTTLNGTLVATNATLSVSNLQAQTGFFSGALSVTGNVNVAEYLLHDGDSNTGFRFQPDQITGYAGNFQWLEVTTTATVFNIDGTTRDAIIEGDTDPSLVFVDAGNDRVGIGDSTPGYKLEVNGSVYATAHVQDHTPYVLSTNRTWTVSELQKGVPIYVTGASTQTWPTADATLPDVPVIADAAIVVTIRPDASDQIRTLGTTDTDGDGIVSGGSVGDMAIISYGGGSLLRATHDGNWTPE